MIKLWGSRLAYGGLLAFALSVLLAEYYSTLLYDLYHDWTGWRKFTGDDPNQTTGILYKSTWSVLFVSGWWMLARFDLYFHQTGRLPNSVSDDTDEDEIKAENKSKKQGQEEYESNESSPDLHNGLDDLELEKPTLRDLHFGKILGTDNLNDLDAVKSAYRKTIAQYHPDRVRAMGPEIREVAERKAKEINQAYEHFQKKFDKL